MKAPIGASGTFANGAAVRKIAADISTTAKASRRSPRSAGKVDRNIRLPSPDGDSRYGPCIVAVFMVSALCHTDAAVSVPRNKKLRNQTVGSPRGHQFPPFAVRIDAATLRSMQRRRRPENQERRGRAQLRRLRAVA